MARKIIRFPGNPPYNKGIIPQDSEVYSHKAINSEREGYIGVMIRCLEAVDDADDAEVNMVHPGKCWIGPGAASWRRWIIQNYDLTSIEAVPTTEFPGINVDRFVVSRIRNDAYQGKTQVIHLNGNVVEMDVRDNRMPDHKDEKGEDDYIIPHYCTQKMYDLWKKHLLKHPKLGVWDVFQIGAYGNEDLFSDQADPSKGYDVQIVRGVEENATGQTEVKRQWINLEKYKAFLDKEEGLIDRYGQAKKPKKASNARAALNAALEIHKPHLLQGLRTVSQLERDAFAHLQSHRVVYKGKPARYYAVIAPGELYDHSMRAIACPNKPEADAMLMWTRDPLYQIQWDALYAMRDVHTFMRHLSKPLCRNGKPPTTRLELYDNWGIAAHMAEIDTAYQDLCAFKRSNNIVTDNGVDEEQVKSKDRREQLGEVFTRPQLAKHMLSVYPQSDWANPEMIWIETSCGGGVFLDAVLQLHMAGLQAWEPDPVARHKHIVENMLYGLDIMADNVMATIARLQAGSLNHNIKQGDAFKDKFTFDGNIKFTGIKDRLVWGRW